jgi:hypothetical protein
MLQRSDMMIFFVRHTQIRLSYGGWSWSFESYKSFAFSSEFWMYCLSYRVNMLKIMFNSLLSPKLCTSSYKEVLFITQIHGLISHCKKTQRFELHLTIILRTQKTYQEEIINADLLYEKGVLILIFCLTYSYTFNRWRQNTQEGKG